MNISLSLSLKFFIATTAGTHHWLATSWQTHCLLAMLWMDLDGASSCITWLLILKKIFCGSSLDPLVRSNPWRWSEIFRPTNARASASSPWRITTRPWWPYRASMDTLWAIESSKFRSRPTSARHKSSNPVFFRRRWSFFSLNEYYRSCDKSFFLNFFISCLSCVQFRGVLVLEWGKRLR